MSQSQSLEFHSAMENFSVMFPDMDSEVIEEILRCNRGSVERTIDQLLSISSDNQNEKIMRDEDDQGLESGSSATPVKQSVSKTPDIISANRATKTSSSSNASPSNHSSRWKPVLLPLEQDFLRLTSDEYCDEFAVMLQNEEFLAELRFNQEFLSSLDREGTSEYGSFDEKIKHMGKISRKKFQQLAKMFTFQRKKNASLKPKSSKLLEESEDEQDGKGGGSSSATTKK